MIRAHRHVLAVPDLARSCAFYQQALGFTVHEMGDPGWRWLERDGCVLMLGECPDALPAQELGDHSYFAYWEVEDVQQAYERALAAGAEILKPPTAEAWGMKEMALRTVDGHRLMLGQEWKAPGPVLG